MQAVEARDDEPAQQIGPAREHHVGASGTHPVRRQRDRLAFPRRRRAAASRRDRARRSPPPRGQRARSTGRGRGEPAAGSPLPPRRPTSRRSPCRRAWCRARRRAGWARAGPGASPAASSACAAARERESPRPVGVADRPDRRPRPRIAGLEVVGREPPDGRDGAAPRDQAAPRTPPTPAPERGHHPAAGDDGGTCRSEPRPPQLSPGRRAGARRRRWRRPSAVDALIAAVRCRTPTDRRPPDRRPRAGPPAGAPAKEIGSSPWIIHGVRK